MKYKILLVVSIVVLLLGTTIYYKTKQNQINTPEKLFTEFIKAQKNSDKDNVKRLSCAVFPNLSTEYNNKVFEDYYTKISSF